MKSVALKAFAVAAIASGIGAAPAMAAPVELVPAGADTSVTPVAGLVPMTGSAGMTNSITCALKTISASAPCLLT
ncbi:hypothetical protein [Nocardia tengchongensis]|uniref:hypothetical protein n=1 Tax=Nocardia tengchongensis TaxID=2055889 RepID=UPI0036836349